MVGAVARLKRRPGGNILMYGCGRLAYTLVRAGLFDAVQVWVHPVVAGGGVRLFRDPPDPTVLRLADASTLGSGVVVLTYEPAAGAALPPLTT